MTDEHTPRHVAVVGAGARGAGIAQTVAISGSRVTMVDTTDTSVARGAQTIAASLDRLVERVRGARTSDTTYATVEDLARTLGKTPVSVNDYPGFVSNRVLMPMLNEAMYCLMEGVAERDAIDTVMKLGMAHPMGPLQLA